MDQFKFFDDDEPLPPWTPLDVFCMAMCGIALLCALCVFAAQLFI